MLSLSMNPPGPCVGERGFTLLEMLSILAFAVLLLALAAVAGRPLIGNEKARGAVYEIQSVVQLARMEAVTRNRETRLLLCPAQREMMVTDTFGTVSTSDDQMLYGATFAEGVMFQHPGGGAAVGWESLGGSPAWFQIRFASDGTVEAGEGDVVVHGGEHYGRVAVFSSGASQVTKWRQGSWEGEAF